MTASDAERSPSPTVPTDAGETRPSGAAGWALWVAVAAFVLVVVAVTLYAAGRGVRGSDQYWYLADVETLVRDHVNQSNSVFPVGLLGSESQVPPPFIHNVLSLYLAVPFAMFVGGLWGWVSLNLVATLATALLIYLAARQVADRWAALVVGLAYPLLPVVVWHTAQPLTEASTAFFAGLSIFLLAISRTITVRWLALVGALGLLYFSRESYLPLLLAAPLAFLVSRAREHPAGWRGALAPTVLLTVAALGIAASAQVIFSADSVRFSYTRLLHAAVPGVTTNMSFNFDLSAANLADRLPFDAGLMGTKLIDHLAAQFVAFDSAPAALFYWTFNILAIIACVMAWRCRTRPLELRMVIGALAFVAIHVVTIALFQNEVRYTVPALPSLLVVFAIALSQVPTLARYLSSRSVAIIVVVTLLALLPAIVLASVARADAVEAGGVESAAAGLFDRFLSSDDHALIVYDGSPQVFADAARPRLILYVSPDYSTEDTTRLLGAFPAHWLFAPVHSPLLTQMRLASDQPVGTVDADGARWGLYRLADR